MRGYDFADTIVVSDGGSTDDTVSLLEKYPKVELHHFDQYEEKEGYRFNPDNPHINFVLDKAKEHNPDWLIFDDFDCVPNIALREGARDVFEHCTLAQINVFRLYMWNSDMFFPQMNSGFDPNYKSLWAWKPAEIGIRADNEVWHGTIIGTTGNNLGLDLPLCLLHKSWSDATVQEKIKKYKLFGIDFGHPYGFAGTPVPLPEYAREE